MMEFSAHLPTKSIDNYSMCCEIGDELLSALINYSSGQIIRVKHKFC